MKSYTIFCEILCNDHTGTVIQKSQEYIASLQNQNVALNMRTLCGHVVWACQTFHSVLASLPTAPQCPKKKASSNNYCNNFANRPANLNSREILQSKPENTKYW